MLSIYRNSKSNEIVFVSKHSVVKIIHFQYLHLTLENAQSSNYNIFWNIRCIHFFCVHWDKEMYLVGSPVV